MHINEINLSELTFKKLHNKTQIIIIKFKKQAKILSKKLFQISYNKLMFRMKMKAIIWKTKKTKLKALIAITEKMIIFTI